MFTCLSLSGVILKMARMTKDGSSRGQKSAGESVSKAPSKTLIIPAKELVQVIAKVLLFFLLYRLIFGFKKVIYLKNLFHMGWGVIGLPLVVFFIFRPCLVIFCF